MPLWAMQIQLSFNTGPNIWAFPDGTSGKEPDCQCRRLKRRGFDPWVGKIPWRRAWQPTLYPCLENLMDRGAWQATALQSRTWLKWLSISQMYVPSEYKHFFKLAYNCFTVLCFCCTKAWIRYMYSCIPSLPTPPSPRGHPRAPSWAPCVPLAGGSP